MIDSFRQVEDGFKGRTIIGADDNLLVRTANNPLGLKLEHFEILNQERVINRLVEKITKKYLERIKRDGRPIPWDTKRSKNRLRFSKYAGTW
jgi:hypothetical protein